MTWFNILVLFNNQLDKSLLILTIFSHIDLVSQIKDPDNNTQTLGDSSIVKQSYISSDGKYHLIFT